MVTPEILPDETQVDPRVALHAPRIDAHGRVRGRRCQRCARGFLERVWRCPWCGSNTSETGFEPKGVVWASTLVCIPFGGRRAPFSLSYIDLLDGPRVLVAIANSAHLAIGTLVRLIPTQNALEWCSLEVIASE